MVGYLQQTGNFPDYLFINSCVWDLSRWGPNGVDQYKEDVPKTLKLFNEKLPKTTRVIFTTTLPLSSECSGGFLSKEIEFLRYVLPWHIMEANRFVAEAAREHKYDVLDLHYHTRFLIEEWKEDGIHFSPTLYRFMTNMILTHLALVESAKLPDVVTLDGTFLERSTMFYDGKEFESQRNEQNKGNGFKPYSKNKNSFSQGNFHFKPRYVASNFLDCDSSLNTFCNNFCHNRDNVNVHKNSSVHCRNNFNNPGHNFLCNSNNFAQNNFLTPRFNFSNSFRSNNNVVPPHIRKNQAKLHINPVFFFGSNNSKNNNNFFNAACGNFPQNFVDNSANSNNDNKGFYMENTFPQMNLW